jgi:alpha-glucosidase
MPWSSGNGAGFSAGKPWLPIPEAHRALAVELQQDDADSTLNGFRAFMRWRRTQPALRAGDIAFLDAPEPLLVFTRRHEQSTLLVAINLGAEPLSWPLPAGMALQQIACPGPSNGRVAGRELQLPGHSAIYAHVSDVAPA